MTTSDAPEIAPVTVSRRIPASAEAIFAILADPARHTELDGSDMLRGAATSEVVTATGDVFVLNMYYSRLGDYQMANHVVEFEPGRRIAWEPRQHNSDETPWYHRWGYTLAPDGPAATLVTHDYDCSRAPADERENMSNGRVWIEAMTATLENLDRAATGNSPGTAA